MTPEYLEELADIADPSQLWRLPGLEQIKLPPEKRRQLDAGVALRRHAAHVRELQALIGTGRSLLLTPHGNSVTVRGTVPTPQHGVHALALLADDIPAGVVYSLLAENFYKDGKGQGSEFFQRWYARRREFPRWDPPAIAGRRTPTSPVAQPAVSTVPPEWRSDQCGGDFDDLTAGQAFRKGWNACRAAMLDAQRLVTGRRRDG